MRSKSILIANKKCIVVMTLILKYLFKSMYFLQDYGIYSSSDISYTISL